MTASTAPHVYTAIAEVMADLSREGIGKDRKNDQQGYKFRGIDDVYNALAPTLAKHKLCVIPRVIGRDVTERTNQRGTALFYVVCDVEFSLVSALDGSAHVARVVGEAMDSGDKATNKAMSAAYKYMAMQTFCIPTEGDNDADATTHEVKAEPKPTTRITPEPQGPDWWGCEGSGPSAYQAKKDGKGDEFEALRSSLTETTSGAEWRKWCADNTPQIASMPRGWRIQLRAEAEEHARELGVDLNQRRAA